MDKIICIDGNIGAGKSTVLNILKEQGLDTYNEKIEEWPLGEFYKNPDEWALFLHICILRSMRTPRPGLYERCPHTAKMVFWEMANRPECENGVFKDYYNRVGWKPDIHILIRTPPEVCMNNIKKRTQVGDDAITIDYLRKIDVMYDRIQFDYVVDGSQDPYTVANTIKHLID